MFLWISSRTPSDCLVLCSRQCLPWFIWCPKSNVDILRWQSTCRYQLILIYLFPRPIQFYYNPGHNFWNQDNFEIFTSFKFFEIQCGSFPWKVEGVEDLNFILNVKVNKQTMFQKCFQSCKFLGIQKHRCLKLLKLVYKRHFFVQKGSIQTMDRKRQKYSDIFTAKFPPWFCGILYINYKKSSSKLQMSDNQQNR